MEGDFEEEEFRELSHSEYEALTAEIRAARAAEAQSKTAPSKEFAKPQATPKPEPRKDPGQNGEPNPEAMELVRQIWQLRKAGTSIFEIHRKLGIPLRLIHSMLEEFERQLCPDVGKMLRNCAALDNELLEDLLKVWGPIATSGPVRVEKTTRAGEVYTELDSDLPLKASYLVLAAIERRLRILAASQPESDKNWQEGTTNVLLWLQTVLPNMQQGLEQGTNGGAPRSRETLVLETEVERLE